MANAATFKAKSFLKPTSFESLDGFAEDNLQEAWNAFIASCDQILAEHPPIRPAVSPSRALIEVASKAIKLKTPSGSEARHFFTENFAPFALIDKGAYPINAFFTGYFEPKIDGSLTKTKKFLTPIYARPKDLVSFNHIENPDLPGYFAGRRLLGQGLVPYLTRQEIEMDQTEKFQPIAWVADEVDAFIIHVQGSAEINLNDGRRLKLTYSGRNGHPYSSIGKVLIDEQHIKPDAMSLASLKAWIRSNGLAPGENGRNLLWKNASFIFFDGAICDQNSNGPIGGASIPLAALRSIATDRTIWPYGTPFWINAQLPWRNSQTESFQRLLFSQDTGSAIVGEARFDIFFGSGVHAGDLAGGIRHPGEAYVLLPK